MRPRRGGARTKRKPKRRAQLSAELVLPKYIEIEGKTTPVRLYAEQRGHGNRYYYLETTTVPKKTTTSVATNADASAFSLAELDDLVRVINEAPIPNSLRSYVDPLTQVLPRPQHDVCRIVVEGGEIDPCICGCNEEDGVQNPAFRRRNKAPVTRKNIIAVVRDPIMKQAYVDALRLHAKQHYAKRTVKRHVAKSVLRTAAEQAAKEKRKPTEYTFELLGDGFRALRIGLFSGRPNKAKKEREFAVERLKDMYLICRKNQREHVGEERGLHSARVQELTIANPTTFVEQLIKTTVVFTKPSWFKIEPTVYMAEIWLLNTSPKDEVQVQDVGKFVRVIPNLPVHESWKWKDGELPCTYHMWKKGDPQEYILCTSADDRTTRSIDRLNEYDKYYVTPAADEAATARSRSRIRPIREYEGHQLRLNRAKEPWRTQDAFRQPGRTEQDQSHYFVQVRVARDLLAKCFTGDEAGTYDRMDRGMDEHLRRQSVTCTVVEATEEEEMSKAMQNLEVQQQHSRKFQYIVVHVYVVVNNEQDDPHDPYTSWNITGISLRSTRTFVT
jgi:hypothetical protein